MSRNEFRLRSVIRARQRDLDAATGRLADELREKDREKREQKLHQARLRDTSKELHDRLTRGSSAGLLRTVDGAMEASHMGAVLAGERAAARDATIRDARAKITDARKRLRSIEILEDHWREQVRRERSRNEQKQLDEIAIRLRGEASS